MFGNEPKPTPGRIVLYRLSDKDAERINAWREHQRLHEHRIRRSQPGLQAHVGNTVTVGEVVPLMIVRAWSDTMVNGQATLDGNDRLWVTSAERGTNAGQWDWPPRA